MSREDGELFDGVRALAVFGASAGLLLVWVAFPPAAMVGAVVGRPVDSLWPNLVACAVLVALGSLAEVGP